MTSEAFQEHYYMPAEAASTPFPQANLSSIFSIVTNTIFPAMNQQHVNMPNEDDIELGSIRRVTSFHFHDDHSPSLSSSRPSLENYQYYRSRNCDIHIHDDVPAQSLTDPEEADRVMDTCSWHRTSGSSDELKARLLVGVRLTWESTLLTPQGPGSG